MQLDVDHPLHGGAEILAAEAVQGFPVPSLGVAVARVLIGFNKGDLISMELWQRLTAPGTTCEGGVLMRLSESLSSAVKATSMREELWMVDNDAGIQSLFRASGRLGEQPFVLVPLQ